MICQWAVVRPKPTCKCWERKTDKVYRREKKEKIDATLDRVPIVSCSYHLLSRFVAESAVEQCSKGSIRQSLLVLRVSAGPTCNCGAPYYPPYNLQQLSLYPTSMLYSFCRRVCKTV